MITLTGGSMLSANGSISSETAGSFIFVTTSDTGTILGFTEGLLSDDDFYTPVFGIGDIVGRFNQRVLFSMGRDIHEGAVNPPIHQLLLDCRRSSFRQIQIIGLVSQCVRVAHHRNACRCALLDGGDDFRQ